MRIRAVLLSLTAAATAAAVGVPAVTSAAEVGAPASVVDFTPDSTVLREYATTDYTSGKPVQGTTTWRVVNGTGNAAELWLTGSREGRIYDLGGRYLNYSDDRGVSWKSVRPAHPLVNGEGSVVMAPNGDVLGVTWDPYAADQVVTYKYTAADKQWRFMVDPLHTPFWDRPGIQVVPGPFTTATGTVPYISFINGLPHDPWYYSTDGLNYINVSPIAVDQATTATLPLDLTVAPDPAFDWIQPNQYFPFAALGGGRAVKDRTALFSPTDMKWHKTTAPAGVTIPGTVHTDGLGRLHATVRNGAGFDLRTSVDGGRTWRSATAPDGVPGDFRAVSSAGVAAVWALKGTQDLLYTFDISGDKPRLLRRYVVGKGDDTRTGGIGFYGATGGHRYDFSSVVVFPDGKVALSFIDSTTTQAFPTLGLPVVSPALAVELDSTIPG